MTNQTQEVLVVTNKRTGEVFNATQLESTNWKLVNDTNEKEVKNSTFKSGYKKVEEEVKMEETVTGKVDETVDTLEVDETVDTPEVEAVEIESGTVVELLAGYSYESSNAIVPIGLVDEIVNDKVTVVVQVVEGLTEAENFDIALFTMEELKVASPDFYPEVAKALVAVNGGTLNDQPDDKPADDKPADKPAQSTRNHIDHAEEGDWVMYGDNPVRKFDTYTKTVTTNGKFKKVVYEGDESLSPAETPRIWSFTRVTYLATGWYKHAELVVNGTVVEGVDSNKYVPAKLKELLEIEIGKLK